MRRGGEGTSRDGRGGEEKGGAGEGEELLYIVIWTHRHNDIYINPSTHLQDLQTPFHFIPHDPSYIILYPSVLSSTVFLFPTFSLTEAPPLPFLNSPHTLFSLYTATHLTTTHSPLTHHPSFSLPHSQISYLSPAASVTAPHTGPCSVSMADV